MSIIMLICYYVFDFLLCLFGLQRYEGSAVSPIPKNSEIAQKQAFGAVD